MEFGIVDLSNSYPLYICLLGPFKVWLSSQPMRRLRTRSVEQLLALFTVNHDHAIRRASVAQTFWPESNVDRALYNVRRNLMDLRQALGPEAGRIHSGSPGSLTFRLAGAASDVQLFDEAVSRGDERSLQQAVTLYRGPFLPGCSEPWAVYERDSRQSACSQARETLVRHALNRQDYTTAEHHSRMAISMGPYHEQPYRTLMEVLASSNRSVEAVEAYFHLRQILDRRLNMAPSEETRALFQQIRANCRWQS